MEDFEFAIRTVCEPIFLKTAGRNLFRSCVAEPVQYRRRFNMEVQPQLVLLQKTLLVC